MFTVLLNTLTIKAFKRSAAASTAIFSILFVILAFTGCSGRDWDDSNLRNLYGYKVSFYSDKLDLLEADSVIKGDSVDLDIKKSDHGVDGWYIANNSTPINGTFTPSDNINFYAAANVIEISNQSELNDVRNNTSGKYILINDIGLKAGDGFDETAGWLPIGNGSNPFSGTFSGNSHKISGLWMDRSSGFVGLFGFVGGGTIKNLGVLIDDDHGGIKGGIGSFYSGGIVGYLVDNSTISNSYSKGAVSANTNVGGIVGDAQENSTLINVYSIGDISANFGPVGGIAGHVGSGSMVNNAYSVGNVSAESSNVGGIAGGVNGGLVTNNAAINQEINGASNVNRVVGYNDRGTVLNNFALSTTNVNGAPKNSAGALDGEDRTSDDFKTQITYETGLGWAFGSNASHPWKMGEDGGYPCLYWED
jgi:hypothetical protein